MLVLSAQKTCAPIVLLCVIRQPASQALSAQPSIVTQASQHPNCHGTKSVHVSSLAGYACCACCAIAGDGAAEIGGRRWGSHTGPLPYNNNKVGLAQTNSWQLAWQLVPAESLASYKY